MADQVTVHAISVLWEFERAISQFQTTAREATLAVESALSATLDRVSRTELAAERHVSWTESSVEAAGEALAECLSVRSEDRPDCSAPACTFEAAGEALAEAYRRKDEIGLSTARIRGAIERYFDQVHWFTGVMTDQMDAARAFLRSRLDYLEEYRTLASASHGRLAGAPQLSRPSPTPDWPAASRFRELGIVSVPVAAIDVSTSTVRSPADFGKLSYADMLEAVRRFIAEVQPKVAQGAGRDYFHQQDRAAQRDYAHGLQRLYDSFYGDDQLRLTKLGSRYVITNGQHRIFVARQLGIAVLPANVAEQIRPD